MPEYLKHTTGILLCVSLALIGKSPSTLGVNWYVNGYDFVIAFLQGFQWVSLTLMDMFLSTIGVIFINW